MNNAIELLNDLNLNPNDNIVVAVSGGADSMALLHFLNSYNFNILVVHFNHQTRKENIDEEKLVIDFCTSNKIDYIINKLEVPNNGNFHDLARTKRYNFLVKQAKKINSKYIFTAHHLDDLAENILIKITRGSNLHGYAGMHVKTTINNINYIRPFLYTDKQNILSYLKQNNVPFLEDSSNFKDDYLRNRYRHAIIPIMKQENDQFLKRIFNFHTQVSKADSFIRKYTRNIINNNDFIDLSVFKEQDIVIQESIIAYFLEAYEISISYDSILTLIELIYNNKPNLTYNLPNGNKFVKSYDKAFITDENLKTKYFREQLSIGYNSLPNMEFITFSHNEQPEDNDFIKICYNEIDFPLWIRTRKNGDILKFDYGHKKLKDYLIDLKIPLYLRDNLLIITDNNDNILWVEDIYTNKTLGFNNTIYIQRGVKC